MALYDRLKQIDYTQLGISDYSRDYIARLLPRLDYYFEIYRHMLDEMLAALDRPAESLTLVDYGGGHGFFSLYMKERGVGRVVYVDYNPAAVQTVQAVSRATGLQPDVVLQGDAATLRRRCEEQSLMPDGLIGLDVIEHIYTLDDFFGDLYAAAPSLSMLFTTASNPYNHRLVNRLRRAMRDDELGTAGCPGFWQQRRQYIAGHFPDFGDKDLDYWATHTRGLVYADVERAVRSHSPNLLRDPYNTCDPATGSWTERILSLEEYRGLVQPYNSDLYLTNGFYDAGVGKSGRALRRLLNRLLRNPICTALAPFIVLHVHPLPAAGKASGQPLKRAVRRPAE